MTTLMRLDEHTRDRLIAERKRLGIDKYDEVWEGMYVMATMPSNTHQELVNDLTVIFDEVVKKSGLGKGYPGINVSDRRKGWEQNFRCPDHAVVLNNSKAIDCGTYFYMGPDFLVEVESPGDDTEEKVPFYGQIGVRELLIIHRDRRTLRLLRHDGAELVEVKPSAFQGKQWLVSEVLPLAFRRISNKGVARTEVRRTDDQPGQWTV
jgi:Uma2 family endonuclease